MFSDFMRLIRLPNIIILILTMCGVRYGLMETIWLHAKKELEAVGIPEPLVGRLQMSGFDFSILMLSIVLIAAAGYLINDYFDLKADRINKPGKVVIASATQRRYAIAGHLTMSGTGMLMGFYVSWHAGNWKLSIIHFFSIIALWLYSAYLKRIILAGNILIAFLAALVPLTIGIFELISGTIPALERLNLYEEGDGSYYLFLGTLLVCGYSLFAFISNLLREIIKDAEDMEGDQAISRKTLPLVLGESFTRYMILFITFFSVFLLGLTQQYIFREGLYLYFWYITFAIQFPTVALGIMIWRSKEKADYSMCSNISKIIIVSGVLSMFIFRYSF